MCFSHANCLPSRLTCLAGGVQKSCLCQTDVYDSLISIVMFPPTSFWGKPWWFGTPIAFSASSVLFQMLPFAYWTYKSMSSFDFQNSLPYFLFWFPGSSEKLEMRGIDPRTSRKLSERSTIWATSPSRKRGAIASSNLLSVIEIVEQRPLLHIVVMLALSVRVINPFVSHMPIACPPDWHASLVVSKGVVYVRRMSLIVLSVEFLFHSASFWGKPWRFGALIDFSGELCTVSDASFCILNVQILVFFWSKKTAYRFSCFDFRALLKNWRCGALIPVPLPC